MKKTNKILVAVLAAVLIVAVVVMIVCPPNEQGGKKPVAPNDDKVSSEITDVPNDSSSNVDESDSKQELGDTSDGEGNKVPTDSGVVEGSDPIPVVDNSEENQYVQSESSSSQGVQDVYTDDNGEMLPPGFDEVETWDGVGGEQASGMADPPTTIPDYSDDSQYGDM